MRRAWMLALAVVVLCPVGASAHVRGCHSRRCDQTARRACAHDPRCVRRVHRHRDARLWAYYRAHPMPYCTWGPESGGNYRAMNPSSSAGGKYQMLNRTFHAYGGPSYGTGHDAAYAPPLLQEKIARRIAFTGWGSTGPQGLHAWVNC